MKRVQRHPDMPWCEACQCYHHDTAEHIADVRKRQETHRHILRIDPDGTLRTLWTDAIPLAELGDLTVKRASEIVFDDVHQDWTIKLVDQSQRSQWTGTIHRSLSRTACLAWERDYFNRQLETT